MTLKTKSSNLMLLAGVFASSIFVSTALSQVDRQRDQTAPTASTPTSAANSAQLSTPSEIAEKVHNWHLRDSTRYKREWGVDIIGARRISSGEMIEFRYRVLDVTKAKALNDKRSTAFMIDQATGKKLVVPQMEKVGLLRTTAPPQLNRVYWMVFANPGNIVKPGSQVNVVIGNFHVDGLIAQ